MSNIFSFEPFKKSSFSETIIYLPNGEDEGISVKAIVTRNSRNNLQFKGHSSFFYPYEIMIDTYDINNIVINKDKILIIDKNIEKNITVKEILPYSDSETWILGCM